MIGHDRELVTCRDGAQGLGTRKICMSHHDPADSPMVQVLHRLGDYRVESARHGHHWLATTVHSEVGHGVVVADHDGGHPLQRLQDPGGGRNGKAFSVVSAERWSEATLCLGERLIGTTATRSVSGSWWMDPASPRRGCVDMSAW